MEPDGRGTGPPEAHRVGDVTDSAQLVIVANRLPFDRVDAPDGGTEWRRSPGGLVSALDPVMRANDGVWIGWPGGTDTDLEPFEEDGLSLVPMSMSAQEIEEFYEGFSNGTLWPLYHDLVAKPEFHREWWDAYVVGQPAVRRARRPRSPAKDATVWVHDYQLQLVPQMLRELRPDLRIGFFLHIPFPPDRAVPAAAVAPPDPRGPARRRPGRLPAAPAARPTSSGWSASGSGTRPTATSSTSPTAAPSARPRSRSRSTPRASRSWPAPSRSPSAAKRSARRSATRPRSSSASTGSTTPRASTPGCGRSAS